MVFIALIGLAWAAPLADIQIEGPDPVLNALARVNLPLEPGQDTATIDLQAAKEALLQSGYFQSVDVSLDGDVLKVKLTPNPPIAAVTIKSQAIPEDVLLNLLDKELALGPGAVYNPVRAKEGAERIAEYYHKQGFPFVPTVSLNSEEKDDGLHLSFEVDETAPLQAIKVSGATLFPASEIQKPFEPLLQKKKFDWALYRAAVDEVNRRYFDAGYRFSGVDPRRTILEKGLLKLYVRELKVAAVDTSALNGVQLNIALGKPLNYDRLLDEIARLSREIGREINLNLEDAGADSVRVVLSPGAVKYGPIKEIRIEGATAVKTADLLAALRLRPNDIFSPALAQEDFLKIRNLYRDAGYEILPRPDFSFKDGVYVQRVHELKIEGYQLEWEGPHVTKDFVILRELPKPGSLLSVNQMRKGISNLLRAGLLASPPQVSTKSGSSPEKVVLVLKMKEARTTVFAPAISWSSLEGWSGQASVESKNLWGRAHHGSLLLSFGQNDAHDNFTLRGSYSIPWLWLPYADFEEVPTSVSLSLYTYPMGNLPLNDSSGNPTGWQYTERRSGGKFSVGRPWSKELDNLKVFVNLDGEVVYPKLEIYDPDKPASPDEATARGLLPAPYQSYSIGVSATYSTVENPNFPSQGYSLAGSLSYGLSIPYGQGVKQFVPTWFTFKTYAILEDDPHQVFAVRTSLGAVLGSPPASRIFYLGGEQSEISTLRGYNPMELSGRYLIGSSMEYRYDFGLKTSFSQTIIGIAFFDFGGVWNPGEQLQMHAGYGLGVQLNLGYGSVLLPALRFDYGFSSDHPTGVFHFRIGPVF